MAVTPDSNLNNRGVPSRRFYSKTFSPQRNSELKRQKSHREADPWVPPGGAYEKAPADPDHERKVEALGIVESRYQPAGTTGTTAATDQDGWTTETTTSTTRAPKRSMYELTRGGDWLPTRMKFQKTWPLDGTELETDWFKMTYVHLFLRVIRFAETYFDYGADIEPPSRFCQHQGAVWTSSSGWGFSPYFIRWAQMVARQDNSDPAGWDTLLLKHLHRRYLVIGIIAKVLETTVFEDLLFGADETQRNMLNAQDESTVQLEGYTRTDLRARTVRAVMGGHTLTPHFYRSVDRLAWQLTELFLPLLRIMDEAFPQQSRLKSTRAMHQDLHHIVAEAGFLSLGIRWTRTAIFRLTMADPGQPYEMEQEHVDGTIYGHSLECVKKIQKEKEERRKRREEGRRALAAEAAAGAEAAGAGGGVRNRLTRVARSSVTTLASGLRSVGLPIPNNTATDLDLEDDYPPRPRMAKVQISIWPRLERFDKITRAEGREEAENRTRLLKAHVVYYSGRSEDNSDRAEGFPRLETWVSQARRRYVVHWLSPPRPLGLGLGLGLFLSPLVPLALLCVLGWYLPFVDRFNQWVVNHVWGDYVKAVFQQLMLAVLGLMSYALTGAVWAGRNGLSWVYACGDWIWRIYFSLFGRPVPVLGPLGGDFH